jgi:uncharacterized protein YbjT (DUF2867 family)
MQVKSILVTGATGYIGGRLVPMLLKRGYRVRCLARDPRKLAGSWPKFEKSGQLEVVSGDVLDPNSLNAALKDVDAAYYLVRVPGDRQADSAERNRRGARNFAQAASQEKIHRIIYLGGIGSRKTPLSTHLRSRHETGNLLRQGTPAVTELRAAMIIGSGSASFEMLRALAEKQPFTIGPRWTARRTQPIAIADTLAYLLAALECPETTGKILDIGGPEIQTYREMIQVCAGIAAKTCSILPVPVSMPRLSAYWANLVTPVPASIAFPIIDSLRYETICENGEAQSLMKVKLTPFRQAILSSIQETNMNTMATRWIDANGSAASYTLKEAQTSGKKVFASRQAVRTNVTGNSVHRTYSRIGGDIGWYYADWLWKVRGEIDRIFGGPGIRRGRRDPERVAIGDAIDIWRVENYQEDCMLLRAEMKVPGKAWLEFRAQENGNGSTALIQTTYFLPNAVSGHLYWFLLWPLHLLVFRGMAQNIVQEAECWQTSLGAESSNEAEDAFRRPSSRAA